MLDGRPPDQKEVASTRLLAPCATKMRSQFNTSSCHVSFSWQVWSRILQILGMIVIVPQPTTGSQVDDVKLLIKFPKNLEKGLTPLLYWWSGKYGSERVFNGVGPNVFHVVVVNC